MSPKQFAKAALATSLLWSRIGMAGANWQAATRVVLFPKLKLAYNRVKKNANTTSIILLTEMETGEVVTGGSARDKSHHLLSMPFSVIPDLREYCFFIVIRNPYSRVLSAFLDKFRFDQYREDFGHFDLTPSGFSSFVAWLQDGGLDKDGHWDLQKKLMFLPLHKYDAIIRFENFQDDMLALLRSRNLTPPEGRLEGLYPSDAGKQTSATLRLLEFYGTGLAEQVAELYREDFKELGYSTSFPPTAA